ncbi:phosphoglucosamine mutase [bacterium]|nr:phosphoglucosamine mutase [bacterium]
MAKPMISVAGIRGTVGGSLVPEEFLKFAAAFASSLDRRVVVLGSDTRPSREMVRHLVLGACMAAGCQVLDLGIVPTPTVGLMTRHLGAGGGIAVTASHNPLDWNALKFFSPDGVFLTRDEMDQVLDRYGRADFDYRPWDELGSVEMVANPTTPHLERVIANVDAEEIRSANFKVAIDLCNGAGIEMLPELLERLGCRVIPILDDPAQAFERVAEPLPENIGSLAETVKREGADLGFAVDPDADRLALVDETGRPIGEERTLTLAARHILQKRSKTAKGQPPPLVANLSTTRALDDVAHEFGTEVERTLIGEANVVERIRSVKAWIGGEGNGGVIYPDIHAGRDAATGMALILEALATARCSLSELNSQVPDYAMVKKKVGIEGMKLADIYGSLREVFSDTTDYNLIDGMKISWPNRWVHVRPSGTEPILRVFAEAPSLKEAESLAEDAMKAVRG